MVGNLKNQASLIAGLTTDLPGGWVRCTICGKELKPEEKDSHLFFHPPRLKGK